MLDTKTMLETIEEMKHETVYLWLEQMNSRGYILAPTATVSPRYRADTKDFNEAVIEAFKRKAGVKENSKC